MPIPFFLLFCTALHTNKMAGQALKLVVNCNDKPQAIAKLNYKKQPGDATACKKEVDKIIGSLRTESYLLAQCDSVYSDSLNYVAYLSAGEAYKTAKIARGNLDLSLASKIGYREKQLNNQAFKYKEIEVLCEKIIRYYEDNGYPFASVKFDSVLIHDNTISAVLNVQKNKLYKIDSIIVKGSARINAAYLQRYLNVKQGMPNNEQT